MRNAIGTTRIFQFVIIFVLIFAAYLALSIKYSKTFKMKNEVINIIERSRGLTDNAGEIIGNYLDVSGYTAQGKCPSGWIGATTSGFEDANDANKYLYCVRKTSNYNDRSKDLTYYRITLFYKFGLPYIDDIFTFEVSGETTDIKDALD